MRNAMRVLVCVAVGFALVGSRLAADSPPPTEEEISARLKEARKRVEAAQAEERELQKRLEDAKAEPRGQIRAEVEGVLVWTDGAGYSVCVRPKDDPKHEIRVALVVPENKVLVGELEERRGKDVLVKGVLLRRADGGLYLDGVELERRKVNK